LIGKFVGHTEDNCANVTRLGRGGLVVIDEADVLATSSSQFGQAGVDALNDQIGKEKDLGTGTIFVLTGYKSGINALFALNDGLRRRLPNTIEFPAYTDAELRRIFVSMAAKNGYNVETKVVDAVLEQVKTARNYLRDKFANAGEIERMLDLMEDSRALKLDPVDCVDLLGKNPAGILQKDREPFRNFEADDVPVFDKNTRQFVLSAEPARSLHIVPFSNRKAPKKGGPV
jgi:hypothetical protein